MAAAPGAADVATSPEGPMSDSGPAGLRVDPTEGSTRAAPSAPAHRPTPAGRAAVRQIRAIL